ncbi:MAG: Bpu10I family restriction endonuclease, partial [Okeania sp. SIO2D1]|nr:Bpu10I family restriction endonuclease [Okeania sp. SIO2D1]
AIYILVAEWLKLTDAVNLRKFKIDQIYVLRKQKNTDREFRFHHQEERISRWCHAR